MMENIKHGSTEWYFLKAKEIKSTMSKIKVIELEIDIMNGQFLKKPRWIRLMLFMTTPFLSLVGYKKIKGLMQIKTP